MNLHPSNQLLLTLMVSSLLFSACGGSQPAKDAAPAPDAKPAAPAVPPQVQAAAEAALGSEVTVLRHGDLARTGNTHVLAANLFKVTPTGVAPGTLFTRAVILAQDGEKWREVLRCDEYLKNAKGFMGGTPLAPIAGWRLQHEMNEQNGLTLYFTPIYQPKSGAVRPIGVRWNPKVKRYQSLDRNYDSFLDEAAAIDKPETVLR